MRNRAPSFDRLEPRALLSGTQVDPNYDLITGWKPDPNHAGSGSGDTPIIQYTPTVVYPTPGPATYEVGAGGIPPY